MPFGDTKRDSTDDAPAPPPGRLLGIDLGSSRVGLAVSDELGLTARVLPALRRTNWKALLRELSRAAADFDARALVVGLPLRLDGTEGEAAEEARRVARNLRLSLKLPVHLQDERLTSRAAEEQLRAEGAGAEEVARRVDGEAARLILLDFLSRSRV
jgi:putative holliday junction resolvase